MIPKQEDVTVYSNSENEKGFTINASREAFRILSSGLYANKPQAIIRELSCNAYDSHVMAGCPERPFKIHLPDSWEPFLSIEDFGIGLDDDDINNIYTSYFSSTKRTSNDTIGGKGLGSKTPFSYTDTFTIRARKDSVERVYNAYVSQAGSPTVSLMSEVDTDEPNGVLITVPVRAADFKDFAREANNVFEYFDVSPIGWSGDNSIVQELKDNNGILIKSNGYNGGNIIVVMGTVAYNVKVTESEIPSSYTKAWSFIKKSNLIIRFGIGDLSTTASRETIDFDEETKEIFIDRIENIIDEYYASFQAHVDTCATVFEALAYAAKELGEWAWNLMVYKGESLHAWANRNVLDDVRAILDPDEQYVDGELRILTRGYSNQLSTNVLKDKWGTHRLTYKGLRDEGKIGIFMDDTDHGRGFDQMARKYIRDQYFKHEIMLDFVITDEQEDKLLALLGTVYLGAVYFSKVKESYKIVREKQRAEAGPRKDPVVRAKKNQVRVDIWHNDSNHRTYQERELVDIDELATKRVGLMVVSRGYCETNILGIIHEPNNSNLIYLCKLFELDNIVIVRPSQLEWIKEKMDFLIDLPSLKAKDIRNNEVGFLYTYMKMFSRNLKDFYGVLEESKFATKIDNEIFMKHYKRNQYEPEVLISRKVLGFVNIPELSNEIHAMSLVDKLKDAMNFFNEDEIAASFGHVDMILGDSNPWYVIYENYTSSIAERMLQRNKAIIEKYPLLTALQDSIYYENGYLIKNVNDYIQMIHEKSLATTPADIEDFLPVELFDHQEEKELYEETV